MSDQKLLTLSDKQDGVLDPTTDMTPNDLKRIEEYVAAGLPGIMTIDEPKMARILDLYLSGKTYHQISRIMQVQKQMILYLAKKFNWFEMRKEYLVDMESSIRGRMIEAKIVNQDFLLQLAHMYQKKIGNKLEMFLRTGDEQHADNISVKDIDKYLKTVEILQKLSGEAGKGAAAPAVGLNLGDGVTVKKVGDTVEITPKQNTIGEMLKQFADYRREEQNKSEKGDKE